MDSDSLPEPVQALIPSDARDVAAAEAFYTRLHRGYLVTYTTGDRQARFKFGQGAGTKGWLVENSVLTSRFSFIEASTPSYWAQAQFLPLENNVTRVTIYVVNT